VHRRRRCTSRTTEKKLPHAAAPPLESPSVVPAPMVSTPSFSVKCS
jgi:hypothetical protein